MNRPWCSVCGQSGRQVTTERREAREPRLTCCNGGRRVFELWPILDVTEDVGRSASCRLGAGRARELP